MREPRLEAKCPENVVDFPFLKIDGQVVGSVAGTLLVAMWFTRELVVIAECLDEAFCLQFVRCQSAVTGELLCAGYLDEDILQTRGKADDAVRLP